MPGKERRKSAPGKAGLLGVEGVPVEVIAKALAPCMSGSEPDVVSPDDGEKITTADLYADGFLGTPGASCRREQLLRLAGLPTRLSTNAMLALLQRLHGRDGYQNLLMQLREETENKDR